eukprot:TRINITY_DN13948_c0_g2_i1.p1 TRINITY_DN13948_c0_g2~~TRINITY_DN13948_c0_g2_i1.p1  ORF type:complete len:909 (+),score=149.97 TRINITY_DN13948_c0_g2_i1:171-2729(+)
MEAYLAFTAGLIPLEPPRVERGFSGVLRGGMPPPGGPPGAPPGDFPASMAPGWVKDAVLELRSTAAAQAGVELGMGDVDSVPSPPDHYKALEVAKTADESAIKKSYRKLVLQWHPDKHQDSRDEADEKIRWINGAYEVLSNPLKRAGYDTMMEAMERKRKGVRLETSFIMPRMSIPKEFMLCPLGHPDKFVRVDASNTVVVQSREDGHGLTFDAFFQSAKFSLWWMPEVNNMCRCRSSDSVTTDLGSGFNLNFNMEGTPTVDGKVNIQETDVVLSASEDPRYSYMIAVASPYSPGAFRFEGAFWPGHYLSYREPSSLRMAGLVNEMKDITDFILVDHSTACRHMTMDEALLGPVLAHGGKDHAKLSDLRADPRLKMYFQQTLGCAVWTNREFEMYFEGHYHKWDFDKKRARVRARPPGQILAEKFERLPSARGEVVDAVLQTSAEALSTLPPLAAASVLKKVQQVSLASEFPQVVREKASTVWQRLLAALPTICSSGSEAGIALQTLLTLQGIVAPPIIHGRDDAECASTARNEALTCLGTLIWERIQTFPDEVDPINLCEILETASIAEWQTEDTAKLLYVVAASKAAVADVGTEQFFRQVAKVMIPRFRNWNQRQLVDTALAVGALEQCRELLEVLAPEALSRLPDLTLAELTRLFQGLSLLGSNHPACVDLLDYLAKRLEDDDGRGPHKQDDEDMQADDLAVLMQLVATVAPSHTTSLVALGSRIARASGTVTSAGKAALEAVFPSGSGPTFDGKDHFLRVVLGLMPEEDKSKKEVRGTGSCRLCSRSRNRSRSRRRSERRMSSAAMDSYVEGEPSGRKSSRDRDRIGRVSSHHANERGRDASRRCRDR